MKKKVLIAVLVLALALSVVFALTLGAGAEENDPTLNIGGKKLVLGNSVYLTYMVSAENVADINDVSVLVWNEPKAAYVKGTEKYEIKTNGKTEENNGITYYEFIFEDVAAMRLADDFYAVAYVEVDGVAYYSEAEKYSVLKYAYNMMGKLDKAASTNTKLLNMLDAMLDYGAAAQYYFDDYKIDRLANADFYQVKTVGGKLADGFTDGLYLEGDEVVITADAPAAGYKFAGWQKGSTGEIEYTDATATVTVGTANETYTAVYEADIPDLTAIVGKWKGTENAYVVTNDYEFVIEADKIASAKYGTTVMNVTTVTFDGTTLTVNYTVDGIEGVKTIKFTYADGKLTCDAAVAGATLELSKTVAVSIDYGASTQADKTVEVAYGASYKLTKPSSYTGYNFKGWYINGEFVATTSAYTISAVTEDTTAVAVWEIKTFDVKFYDQDFNIIKTVKVEYGTVLSAEDIPTEGIATKEGYTFSGNWASSKTSTTPVDLTAAIKNGKNYYPIMIEPQVPVSNLAGTWVGTETEDNSNSYYDIVNIITREYTFVIDAEGNITIPTLVVTVDNGDGDITGPTTYTDAVVSDVTFNGTVLKLTVTYDGTTKKTYSFTYDEAAATLTKSSSFVLAKGATEPEEPEVVIPDLTAIVGKWVGTESLVSVKYEFIIEADKIASAKYGTTVMNVTTVTFDGTTLTVNYTIEGAEDVRTIVFTYADGKLSTDSAAATGSLTLSKKVTVTLNYGEKGGSDKVTEYDYGKTLSKPSASWTGYNFLGWTLNGKLVETYPITLTEDITLVATWEIKVFDVIFWNQDYTVAIKTVKVKYGEYVPADEVPTDPALIVTMEGYEFAGTWRTSKSSTTVTDPTTKKITSKNNFYPNMIEPQVPVSNLAGTWVGTETEDNSYPSYGIIDLRTREYTFVIDAEGNITVSLIETIDDGEEQITATYTDCVVSNVSFNGTVLKVTVTYKEGSSKHNYEFTYNAEAGTLYENSYFTLTKA